MENYTTHLLLVYMDMEKEFHSPRCKMEDQQMAVTSQGSTPMRKHNMLTH
jgi:hypothetical protein